MLKVAKDVYVESGFAGVTVGAVVTPDGIICIDTPTHPAEARKWRLRLAQLSEKPVRFVINLDAHRDRVLGNAWFEAPVIAHEATYERVRQLPELFKGGPSEAGADADLAADLAGVRVVAPSLTFTDRLTLSTAVGELHLRHHPGASPGGVWLELPEQRVVFTGDAVTHGIPPFMHEADLETWLADLEAMNRKSFAARVIVPGRGAPLEKKGVKATVDFLKLVRRKVNLLVRARKPRLEAAALAEGLLDEFDVPDALHEHYLRRLRAGLEHVFDTLSSSGGMR